MGGHYGRHVRCVYGSGCYLWRIHGTGAWWDYHRGRSDWDYDGDFRIEVVVKGRGFGNREEKSEISISSWQKKEKREVK